MKTILSILCLNFVALFSLQAQKFGSIYHFGDQTSEIQRSVCSDSKNSVIASGLFLDTLSFDSAGNKKTLVSAGMYDYYLLKLNCSNDFQWAISIGSNFNEKSDLFLGEVKTDEDDNIYLVGTYRKNCRFNSTNGAHASISAYGNEDGFLCKYSKEGMLLWIATIGSRDEDQAAKLYIRDKKIYVSGNFSGTALITSANGKTDTLLSNGITDAFYAVFDDQGVCSRARSLGNSGEDLAVAIYADSAENVYLGGNFGCCSSGSVNIDGFTINNQRGWGGYLAKFKPNDSCAWVVSAGEIGHEGISCIDMDAHGNLYAIMLFEDTTILHHTNGANDTIYAPVKGDDRDFIIMKIAPDGSFLWNKAMGGNADDVGFGLTVTTDNKVVISGFFASTKLEFGNGKSASALGMTDVFIALLDSNGSCEWMKTVKSAGEAWWGGHVLDKFGNILMGIFFKDSTAIGQTKLYSTGAEDAAIFRVVLNNQLNIKLTTITSGLSCSIDSLVLKASNNTIDDRGVLYDWFVDSIQLGKNQTNTLVVVKPGNYWFIRHGFCQIDTSAKFPITQQFSFPVNIGNDTIRVFCEDSIVLKTSLFGKQMLWSTGDTSQAAIIHKTGLYWIQIFDTLSGCYGYDTVFVVFDTATITLGNDTTVCGNSFQIKANTSGLSYKWNTGDTTENITVYKSGLYIITASKGFCNLSDSIEVRIDTIPDSTFSYSIHSDTVIFDANATVLSYLWNFGDSTTSIIKSPTKIYTSFGSYKVKLTTTTLAGCVYHSEQNISINNAINLPQNNSKLYIYPNPISSKFFLDYESVSTEPYDAAIYDLSGSLVMKLFTGRRHVGLSSLNVDLDKLAAGSYMLVLRSPTVYQSGKLIKL